MSGVGDLFALRNPDPTTGTGSHACKTLFGSLSHSSSVPRRVLGIPGASSLITVSTARSGCGVVTVRHRTATLISMSQASPNDDVSLLDI